MIPGTNGLRMPLSKPPVICGASLKAFSQKPMVPGAKTRAPGIWASSHLAVLYSVVEWMSMGLSIQRAERRCFLTTGTQAMANIRATARAGRRRSNHSGPKGYPGRGSDGLVGAARLAYLLRHEANNQCTRGQTANDAATQRNMSISRW